MIRLFTRKHTLKKEVTSIRNMGNVQNKPCKMRKQIFNNWFKETKKCLV